MRLYQKLLLGFALVALLVGCVGYVAQTMNQRVESGVLHLSESAVPEISHAIEMTLALRESLAAARDLVAGRSGAGPDALEQTLAAFDGHLAEGRTATRRGRARAEQLERPADLTTADERMAALADLSTAFATYERQVGRLADLSGSRTGRLRARVFLADSVETTFQQALLPPLARYRSSANNSFAAETAAVRVQLAHANRMLFVAVLLAIGMTLVLGILIANSISGPILSLTKATRFVGSGRLDYRLRVRSHDEVGDLTDAFNAMTEELSRTTVSKQYLDTIIHSMADPLLVVNADGVIEMANGAAGRVADCATEDLVGQSIGDLLGGGVAEAEALLGEVIEKGYSVNRETRLCEEGAGLPVSLSAAAMRGDEGEVLGIVCVAKDLTPQKHVEAELIRAKEQAEEVSRLKSNFLANMSHEIRTPLTGIIGSTQVLTGELGGEHLEMVEIIQRASIRLLGTINSVLDMARIEAGELQPLAEPVCVAEEAVDTLDVLRTLADGKGLALTLRERTPDVWAAADPGCLHRILNNLIGNAIKFTRAGSVTVEIDATPSEAVLCVRDTGIGVDEDFLPYLFENFKQESTGFDRSHEGTGLGLAITKQLVDLMGGTIQVESAKGVGSTFTVRLPRTDAPPPPDLRARKRTVEPRA